MTVPTPSPTDDRITLVTGATGFTGSRLVHALVADGQSVRVIARSAVRARDVLPGGVEIIEGDLTDPVTVSRAVHGAGVVYHLAAVYREAKHGKLTYSDVNVGATKLLLEAARAGKVTRFVHCSTVGVHGHIARPPADEQYPFGPGDVYQRSKYEGERLALSYAERYGVPVAVARPTAIYGPGDTRLLKLFRMVAKRRFLLLDGGRVFYHMVYVDDLVRGLRLLGSHPRAVGEVFILGGEEYRTLAELASMIAAELGVPAPWIKLPARPFQMLGSICERVCVPLGIEPPIHRRRVDFYTKSRAFTIEKAKRLLGYRPLVSLEEGIARTAEWYRINGYLGTSADPGAPAETSIEHLTRGSRTPV
ncbi:MAG: NAD-dependent epimerase/dehydratase family protein [Gemmatimonadales bacterium]|nr:NAD-dependent epimerase/dehydratase family protein [Gemmatimonadales bacterium]